jgi:hypothetical protein
MRTIPGSVEEMLVEAIRSYGPLETSPIIQRRVYARVLDVALGRRRKLPKRSRVRARVGLSLLVLTGVAATSMAGLHWIERPRALADQSPARVRPDSAHPPLWTLLGD